MEGGYTTEGYVERLDALVRELANLDFSGSILLTQCNATYLQNKAEELVAEMDTY